MNEAVLKEQEPHGTALFPLRVHEFVSDTTLSERVATHWHPEYELLVVTVGQALLHINGHSYQIQKDDVAIIQPDQLHAITAKIGTPFGFYAVVFDPIFLQSAVPDGIQQQYLSQPLQTPVVIAPDHRFASELNRELATIRQEFATESPAYTLQIKGHLFLAWSWLAQLADPKQAQEVSGGVAVDLTKDIIAYIQQHYAQHLSLTILADYFNLSKSHLCRLFKKTTKMALTDYINATRITRSTELLRTTTESISTIAGQVGFNNISYYNKLFHRRLQMTPSEYRQRK